MKKPRGKKPTTKKKNETASLTKWIDNMVSEEARSEKLNSVENVNSFIDSMMKAVADKKEGNKSRARKKSDGATGGVLKALDPAIRRGIREATADIKKQTTQNTKAIKTLSESAGKLRNTISSLNKSMRVLLEDKEKTKQALNKGGFRSVNDLVTKFNKYKKETDTEFVKLNRRISSLQENNNNTLSGGRTRQNETGAATKSSAESAGTSAPAEDIAKGLGSAAAIKMITDIAGKAATAVSTATSAIGGGGGGGGSLPSGGKNAEENKRYFQEALNKYGVTNDEERAAMAAVIMGESRFELQNELSYSGTPNTRIREIFGNRVPRDDAELDRLKKDDAAFFNAVYGGEFGRAQLGNTQPGDGFKYVGRGFIGLTGRANYEKFSKITGFDLVSNPELANDPKIAAEIAVKYMSTVKKGGGSVYESIARGVGNPVASTEAVKKQAFAEFSKNGEFSVEKTKNVTSDNKSDATQTASSQTSAPPSGASENAGATGSTSSTSAMTPQTPGRPPDVSSGYKPPAGGSQMVTLTTPKSKRAYTVAADVADKFKGFVDELENSGYQIKDIGGYRAGAGQMWHAKGYAIDINPSDNPMFKKVPGGGLQDQVTGRMIPPQEAEKYKSEKYSKFGYGKDNLPQNISQIARKWGLGWGGDWQSSVDTMHFSAGGNEGGTGGGAAGASQEASTPATTPPPQGVDAAVHRAEASRNTGGTSPTPSSMLASISPPPRVGSGIPTAMGNVSRIPGLGSSAGVLSGAAVGSLGTTLGATSAIPAAISMLGRMTGIDALSYAGSLPLPPERGSSIPTIMGRVATAPGVGPSTGMLSTMTSGNPNTMIPQSPDMLMGLVGSLLSAMNTGGGNTRASNPTFRPDQYQDNRVPSAMPPASILREVFGTDIPTVYAP